MEKNLATNCGSRFLALTIQTALSPDLLLTVIEYGKKPGLMSYYATGISLLGVGPAFMLLIYIFIVNFSKSKNKHQTQTQTQTQTPNPPKKTHTQNFTKHKTQKQ